MFKQVWNKLFQTASPCEPFVAGALRFIISHVDAQFAERLHQLLRAHLFVRAAAEEEIMHFLVELTCIGKHTVEARFHVQPENRPAEPANVGEHVETRQRCLERLVSSPRQACHCTVCAYTANSINGVSKLHSEIIKESVFHDYYLFKPQAFKNVTNGIAYRRWLLASNPELCKLLDETIGTGYKHDAADLSKLNKFAEDKTVLKRLNEIKLDNKKNFAAYLEKSTGQVIDPNSIFDCQVKRMHEYKRQHLNALNIAAQYLYLKENPNADFIPKTYIFGAKAAPGYYMAKQMIRMICKLGDLINNDPAVREKLRVVYLEEYCVSLSEHLMPAAEVSEQISLAGTEASGTGNMKFMLNGAITLGTLDGANVEIADAAGKENELIFGMLTPEVNNLKQVGYHPNAFITGDDVANAALNFLERGWNGENFHEVTENLRSSDPYMVMADFKDYRRAQADLQRLYADREHWAKMSLKNIANSGIFSADRAVLDYARDIWHASAVK